MSIKICKIKILPQYSIFHIEERTKVDKLLGEDIVKRDDSKRVQISKMLEKSSVMRRFIVWQYHSALLLSH
jgi:hypothetical protein